MRTTGSLFTFAEMSASIKDGTFRSQSGAVLLTTNECVTVDNATNTIKIVPITGSTTRYPAYHELRPSGSSGGGTNAYVGYTFTRYAASVDGYAILRKRLLSDGTYTTLAVINTSGDSNTFLVDANLYTVSITLYAQSDTSIECYVYADYLNFDYNSAPAYNNVTMGTYSLSVGSLYQFDINSFGAI
jgi:hypothetical protein